VTIASLWGSHEHKAHHHVIILAITVSYSVFADETSSRSSQQTYAPSLNVLMGLTQLRHFKLWYVGNWALADYELGQIKESIQDVRKLYPNVPNADMSSMCATAVIKPRGWDASK
jgi:hypothetical protein